MVGANYCDQLVPVAVGCRALGGDKPAAVRDRSFGIC